MLIRCNTESQHPAEWALGLRLSNPREQERQRDDHNSGVKILQFMFGLQLPLTVKPHTTFSNPCNKERGKYFVKEEFLRRYHCVGMYPAYICIYVHESADDNTTQQMYFQISYLKRNR